MKKWMVLFAVAVAVLSVSAAFAADNSTWAQVKGTTASLDHVAKPADVGFDEYGYNYQARIFVGPADGVDRNLDGTVWGDPTYANDHLVMKWSSAWDAARFDGEPWTPDAWCSNEWNGNVPGGSGEMETFKCVWVGFGPDGTEESSQYWRDGGYALWSGFEAIMDHYAGQSGDWYAHAKPAGYGASGP